MNLMQKENAAKIIEQNTPPPKNPAQDLTKTSLFHLFMQDLSMCDAEN